MKLTYYGTSGAQGLPALFCECRACRLAREHSGRNIMTRAQALLEDESGSLPPLLIDLSPDTLHHVNFYGLPMHKVAHCVITHPHDDHLSLEELEIRCGFSITTPDGIPTLNLYGADKTGEKIADLLKNDKLGRLSFCEILPYTPTDVAGWSVTALRAKHSPSLNSYNYIIEGGGKRVLYATDTAYPEAEYFDYLKSHPSRFDAVTLDCAWTNDTRNVEHMNLADCKKFVANLAEYGAIDAETKITLTHFAHFGLIYDEIVDECRRIYAESGIKFEVAYDTYFVNF